MKYLFVLRIINTFIILKLKYIVFSSLHLHRTISILKYIRCTQQVQIVVYETHSRLELENGGMVKAVVEEMNGWAYEKHNMDSYSSVSADDSNKFSTSVETPWRPAVFHPVEVCVCYTLYLCNIIIKQVLHIYSIFIGRN